MMDCPEKTAKKPPQLTKEHYQDPRKYNPPGKI